jgi:ABC-type glycerol-3-phosphate transport system substrate-binding protein
LDLRKGTEPAGVLRFAGAGAGIAAVPGYLAACGGDTQQGEAPKVLSNEGKLTFWYWGEPDAPRANDWMEENIKAYKEEKPDLEMNVVPQATDTFISSFQVTVYAGQGPDIASQWATGPVLTHVWQDAVVPISDYMPHSPVAGSGK